VKSKDGSRIFCVRRQSDSPVRGDAEILASGHVTKAHLLFPAYHVAYVNQSNNQAVTPGFQRYVAVAVSVPVSVSVAVSVHAVPYAVALRRVRGSSAAGPGGKPPSFRAQKSGRNSRRVRTAGTEKYNSIRYERDQRLRRTYGLTETENVIFYVCYEVLTEFLRMNVILTYFATETDTGTNIRDGGNQPVRASPKAAPAADPSMKHAVAVHRQYSDPY